MIKVDIWTTVRILKQKGQSIKNITKILGMSRNTVRKILRNKSYREYAGAKVPEKSNSIVAAFHDEILRMSTQDYIGSRMLKELVKKGYDGSKTAFYDYLNKIDIGLKISKISQRYETAPGLMSQYDWSPYTVEIGNELVKIHIFDLILCWSRYRKYTWSLDEKQGSVFDGIEEGFVSFDGVTETLLVDNHKTMVTKKTPEVTIWNPKFHEFMGYFGIEPRSCSIGNARCKGKVENPFFYLEQHFIKGNRFRDFIDFTVKLNDFNQEVNHKVHGTTKAEPQQMFAEERPFLKKLPESRFIGLHETFRKVNWDCLISYDGNKYSVPYPYAGKSVWIRTSQGRRLLIWSQQGKVIAEHQLSSDNGKIVIDQRHYEGLRKRKLHSKDFIVQEFKKLFPESDDYIKGVEATKRFNVGYHLNQIIELSKYFSVTDIKEAIEKAVKFNVYSSNVIIGILRAQASFNQHPANALGLKHNIPVADITRQLSEYEKLGGVRS